jgi:pimeloyl-ACP methyl ester carboxylesterase
MSLQPFPGTLDRWNGFERHTFEVSGFQSMLVKPAIPLSGSPWIWRSYFFDAWPDVDRALLSRGFHLGFIDNDDLFGNREACRRFDLFYQFCTETLHLSAKVALEGFSRGGLPVYHWAIQNPEKVLCIYGDAPVCDVRSWPGGMGQAPCEKTDWQKCLAAYGKTEAEMTDYQEGPIERLEPLAKAQVPIVHVVGDADDIVPYPENTARLAIRYRQLGGVVLVITKPGIGHHPHSLEDPSPVVHFIMDAWDRR